jgi:hypothetical protein
MKHLAILLITAAFLLSGCSQYGMQFKSSANLQDKFDHSVKDRHLTIYYSLSKSGAERVLSLAVQNTGNIYMNSLTINYDECCQNTHTGPGSYNYKNLGNLKNRAHKTMNMVITEDVNTVRLKYSYTPVVEDSFLSMRDSSAADADAGTVNGEITLYIR